MDEDYLRHVHQNVEHIPELDARPPILLVGMHTRFYGSESDKNKGASCDAVPYQ